MCIFLFLLSWSHRVSMCPSVHPSLCVIMHVSKISEMWSVPIFKQQGYACQNCPDVQTWPAHPTGGCRLTDIKGSDRRTDPERKPVAMLMKHQLSTAVLSVAGSAKLRGERVDFSLQQAGFIFHTSGNWTLSSVIEFLGCGEYLRTGNEMWHYACYEQNYSDGPVSLTWKWDVSGEKLSLLDIQFLPLCLYI